ncbi:MAG: dephospho-CoA kinase [Candidatus Omnitrophota bacterium]
MVKQNQDKNRTVIGITGGFGTGKTTVSELFKSLGAKVIDADKIAHELIRPRTVIYGKIIKLFGEKILRKNKSIDRSRVSKSVFDDPKLLKRLNKIVHPAVEKVIKEQVQYCRQNLILLDIPLLFEAKLEYLVDKIIVVKTNRRSQFERLLEKTKYDKEDILKRINVQMPLADKIRQADFVIDNNGTIEQTKKQVKEIWRKISIRPR